MTSISDGARNLPLRHISIRVPWNDTGWTGLICQNPTDNISCLVLQRIRETRNDGLEENLAGQSWEDLDENRLPPCLSERGSFMAPYDISRKITHPYSETSNAHKHILPTPYRFPAYSASCIPFRWMLKESAEEIANELELGFRPELEDRAHEIMGFNTSWVQSKHNQLTMLDTYFSSVKPNNSLCFYYAKRTPLAEDNRRVIVGVGWVKELGNPVEYIYQEKNEIESVIWERSVYHSIRPDFSDGFLFPYHEVLEYLEQHPDEDPNSYIAFVPDDNFWSFSYASEHVTNDDAIASLLSCIKAIQSIEKIIPGKWDQVRLWIEDRLNELWKMRGPYPGLGSALVAFGVEHGISLAYEIECTLIDQENLDPWPIIDDLFCDPEKLNNKLQKFASSSLCAKWQALPEERKALLKLVSRFELTSDQAKCFYVHEDERRDRFGINFKDSEILENPYLLYELDIESFEPIHLAIIDRGCFPDQSIREKYPLEQPSRIDDATDQRRVRAFVIRQLEEMAEEGHTLYARHQIIQDIRELDVQPACPIDGDLMNVVEKNFGNIIHVVELAEGQPAYQLDRYYNVGNLIRKTVKRRLQGRRHQADIGWRKKLDELFGDIPQGDEFEEDARKEKTNALEEIFSSRFSVLIGPAGTGKTTLLKVLLNEPEVAKGGVLLLAPTGKARVRLEVQSGVKGGQTIAQFLRPLDRFETSTQRYQLSNREKEEGAQTVIIDEASMLTEEQLAATLDALTGVQRLVLIGDPKQLPPIGAGRPFLDIVTELEPENIESKFPRIGQGYAELTVGRRQQIIEGEERDDLLLADWFSGRPLDPGADEIWTKISDDTPSKYLRFIKWKNSDDLREKLLDVIVEELKLESIEDYLGFEQKMGGTLSGEWVYFNYQWKDKPGAASKIEDWQILSPVRNAPHGVEAINRLVQETFRAKTKSSALINSWNRKIPKPMGQEGILYGDKVINLHNHRRYNVWPKEGALQYLANGEIGIAVGQFKSKKSKFKGLPQKLEIEFSSQQGHKYGFFKSDFSEESEPKLELACALTVHKVQGSEFGFTIIIVPENCRLLSRELLYTGLTRQQNKVIIFHQGERHELKKYSVDSHSEAARRLTNLFDYPNPVIIEHRFLEDNLIHRTIRGHSVRSKSEVIIANILHNMGIDYDYEAPLIGKDGISRYPDFTFVDDEMGITYYLEHLGMLRDPKYRKRWGKKLAWYRTNGILPQEDGGGSEGTLITTKDDPRGGIQADDIEKMLKEIFE